VYDFLQSSNIDQMISSHTSNSLEQLKTLIKIDTNANVDANGVDTMTMLSEVLSHELKETNNLTKWPCLSFWDVGSDLKGKGKSKEKGNNDHDMEDVSKKIASALSPSCTDPFTRCGVKKDLCEEQGDAQCA